MLLLIERGSLALELHLPDALGQTAKLSCVQSSAGTVQSPDEQDSLRFPYTLCNEFPCASLQHNTWFTTAWMTVQWGVSCCQQLYLTGIRLGVWFFFFTHWLFFSTRKAAEVLAHRDTMKACGPIMALPARGEVKSCLEWQLSRYSTERRNS